jgi:hypothetical protein
MGENRYPLIGTAHPEPCGDQVPVFSPVLCEAVLRDLVLYGPQEVSYVVGGALQGLRRYDRMTHPLKGLNVTLDAIDRDFVQNSPAFIHFTYPFEPSRQ